MDSLLNTNVFHIVLFQPQIPPNTGNIIRLCANTGAQLHLIRPLGFTLDEKRLKRAGLDYQSLIESIQLYDDFDHFLQHTTPQRIFAIETCGNRHYCQISFQPGDALLFGSETRGLPPQILNKLSSEQIVNIPMRSGNRSLNLSNSVAVVLYEAWRQNNFN